MQDAQVPKTFKETETAEKTKIEETIPGKPGIEVPVPEATTTDGAVIVETTKEVVILKTEEKAREVMIEDPSTGKESAEDEKANGKK